MLHDPLASGANIKVHPSQRLVGETPLSQPPRPIDSTRDPSAARTMCKAGAMSISLLPKSAVSHQPNRPCSTWDAKAWTDWLAATDLVNVPSCLPVLTAQVPACIAHEALPDALHPTQPCSADLASNDACHPCKQRFRTTTVLQQHDQRTCCDPAVRPPPSQLSHPLGD